MNISILGYKIELEVLILIGVVYLVLVGHTLCGCCHFGRLMEGMENNVDPSGNNLRTQVAAGIAAKEGFTGANTNYGQSSPYDLNSNAQVDTSKWMQPNMTVTPGQPLSKPVQDFLARDPQPVPLPEGEMLLFANTKFAPEYCPGTYSSSSGCAVITSDQYNYLVTRGGNNVPYSEY
jgi:hypothetical protein